MASFNTPPPVRSTYSPALQRVRSEITSEYEERCGSLTDYELDGIEISGKLLGRGSYGVVMELKFRGERILSWCICNSSCMHGDAYI